MTSAPLQLHKRACIRRRACVKCSMDAIGSRLLSAVALPSSPPHSRKLSGCTRRTLPVKRTRCAAALPAKQSLAACLLASSCCGCTHHACCLRPVGQWCVFPYIALHPCCPAAVGLPCYCCDSSWPCHSGRARCATAAAGCCCCRFRTGRQPRASPAWCWMRCRAAR